MSDHEVAQPRTRSRRRLVVVIAAGLTGFAAGFAFIMSGVSVSTSWGHAHDRHASFTWSEVGVKFYGTTVYKKSWLGFGGPDGHPPPGEVHATWARRIAVGMAVLAGLADAALLAWIGRCVCRAFGSPTDPDTASP